MGRKQDCVVGDSSACGRVVLWEQDVGKLNEGESYKLVGASVFFSRCELFVSWSRVCN